jgi:hypothetical protein
LNKIFCKINEILFFRNEKAGIRSRALLLRLLVIVILIALAQLYIVVFQLAIKKTLIFSNSKSTASPQNKT